MNDCLTWGEFTHVITSEKYIIEEGVCDPIPSIGLYQDVGFMMRPQLSDFRRIETNGMRYEGINDYVLDRYGIRPCQVILKETIIYLDKNGKDDFNEYLRGHHDACTTTISGAHDINNFFKKYGINMHFPEEEYVTFEMELYNDRYLSSHGYIDSSDVDDSFVLTEDVHLNPRYEKLEVVKVS